MTISFNLIYRYESFLRTHLPLFPFYPSSSLSPSTTITSSTLTYLLLSSLSMCKLNLLLLVVPSFSNLCQFRYRATCKSMRCIWIPCDLRTCMQAFVHWRSVIIVTNCGILTLGRRASVGRTAVDLLCMCLFATVLKRMISLLNVIKSLNMRMLFRHLCDALMDSRF